MHNIEIARRLEEVADLLEAQRANPFRVQAYRRVAASVQHLPKPLIEIWHEKGEEGLRAVTGAGERLSIALRTLVTTGRLPMLDRLRGEADPVALLERRRTAGCGQGISGESGCRRAADHRTAAVQSIGRSLASDPAYAPRRTQLHGSLFKHGEGPRVWNHPRLGRVVLRRRHG
jgi:hypothetical protein